MAIMARLRGEEIEVEVLMIGYGETHDKSDRGYYRCGDAQCSGVSPVIMVFDYRSGVGCLDLCSSRAGREVERIFDFYIAADAILREEERRWYGFEIAEVIEHGESLLEIMPDPPPLNYYALGALYNRLGNHQATVEYLSRVTEDEHNDETHRTSPSPQLRRYVMMLRRIECHLQLRLKHWQLSGVWNVRDSATPRRLLTESRDFRSRLTGGQCETRSASDGRSTRRE